MYSKKRQPAVLTVAEVAQILRLGRISVYQAIERGISEGSELDDESSFPAPPLRFGSPASRCQNLQHRCHMQGNVRKYLRKSGAQGWPIVFYCGKRASKTGTPKKHYRWMRGFKTEREAQKALKRVLKAADDGVYVEPNTQTLTEYLADWVVAVQPNLAPKTFERYKQLVNHPKH